ncbi:MAG TPA: trypsin-like peptidase domain-containing protein [Verrucomicrobiota bacterium]|nr:trypsin-like peptidase domain-containing protein [Verrucomicrobiota bacterium]HNU50469.1 trypsin-like peptidase domain-containing protein [Verrucomicrobiota bacterium]
MVRRVLALGVLAAAALGPAAADVLHLKDQASITGRILAEKQDQIVVDVGYTVLLVPRREISRIVRDPSAPAAPAPDTRPTPAANSNPAAAATAPAVDPAIDPARPDTPSPDSYQERSVRDWVVELGEAVVQVRTPSGLGSGFFLDAEGYLITNFHVIEGETQIALEVFHQENGQLERKTYRQIRIVAMNKADDLALLKVEDAGPARFRFVRLGSSESMAVGERLFAIGSPLGLERTVTEGILSTKTRLIQGDLFLQTTAQINQGNSGGPLFSLRGEVVGVTNMKLTYGEGLGFAIPVERVRHFLAHRDAFAYDNDNPSNAYRYLEPPRRLRHAGGPDAHPVPDLPSNPQRQ